MTARLPIVGGDDGDWGEILNTFLEVSHNSDGTLASSAVSDAGAELASQKGAPGGYASLDNTGSVPFSQLGNMPAATTSASGIIQLSGDLGGSATSPTVPGAEKTANKNQPNGYAGLDSNGQLQLTELPNEVANANWFTTVMDPLGAFTVHQGTWSMQSGGGTWSVCNSSDPFSGGGAIGDSISTTVKLNAGTYEIDVIHWFLAAGAQFNVLLDSTILGNIDMYASSPSPGNYTTYSDIAIASSGLYTVTFTATGQNASSSGFVVAVQSIQLIKTS